MIRPCSFIYCQLVIFGSVLVAAGADDTVTRVVEEGRWGNWRGPAIAANGHFVYGVRTRFEPYQRGGDDTALNGIRLMQRDFASHQDADELKPGDGYWGEWGPWVRLGENEYIFGMQTRFESPLGRGDDTALNGVKVFIRTKGTSDYRIEVIEQGRWGDWNERVFVPENHCLVGLQLKIEPRQGSGDDTALNGIRMVSRPLPADWRANSSQPWEPDLGPIGYGKGFAQGRVDYRIDMREGTSKVHLHLHGRHNDRAGATYYTTMLLLADASGKVLWVSPSESLTVRGRITEPAHDEHLNRTYDIPTDTLRKVRQGEVVADRDRTPYTNWKEVYKVLRDAEKVYRAMNGDTTAAAELVGEKILKELR